MPPRVVISHSSKDKAIADAICEHLETEGIMRGLETCHTFVLVFSASANGSEHVRREVAKAFSLRLAVIPFRTEAVMPNRSLGYFLETAQWLDAVETPLPKHLGILTERVKQLRADDSAPVSGTTEITPDIKTQPKQSPFIEASALDQSRRCWGSYRTCDGNLVINPSEPEQAFGVWRLALSALSAFQSDTILSRIE